MKKSQFIYWISVAIACGGLFILIRENIAIAIGVWLLMFAMILLEMSFVHKKIEMYREIESELKKIKGNLPHYEETK